MPHTIFSDHPLDYRAELAPLRPEIPPSASLLPPAPSPDMLGIATELRRQLEELRPELAASDNPLNALEVPPVLV